VGSGSSTRNEIEGRWDPRYLKPCPSEAAYRRHRRRGEEACDSCKRAHADYVYAWKRANRKADADG
jgi:hypothetical protein